MCVCVCVCLCACVRTCVWYPCAAVFLHATIYPMKLHMLQGHALATKCWSSSTQHGIAQHEMHTLTFTACVQTASPPVAEVCVCIVPHKREQSRVVEEADALHTMGCNEEVGTQLGNVAN